MRITLLTQQSCELCDQAHTILAGLTDEYGFELTTLSFGSKAGTEIARRGGLLFAPGVLIDDEPFSHGRLSARKLRRELNRRIRADVR